MITVGAMWYLQKNIFFPSVSKFPFFFSLLFPSHLSLTERNRCFYYFYLTCMVPRLHPTVHDPSKPLVITRQNSQCHEHDVEGFEHYSLHVHTTVTSGADRDKIDFRLFNSSSIRIKQPKLNLVTVGRDSSFPYYYTRAVARQEPPLYRHSDSVSGPPRSTVTCRLLNLLFHVHTKLGYTDYLYTKSVAHQDPPLSETPWHWWLPADPLWHGDSSIFDSIVTPRQLPGKTLCYIDTLTLVITCQDSTWRFFNFFKLLHDHHTKNRVQWVFPYSRINFRNTQLSQHPLATGGRGSDQKVFFDFLKFHLFDFVLRIPADFYFSCVTFGPVPRQFPAPKMGPKTTQRLPGVPTSRINALVSAFTNIWGLIYGHVCENGVTREVLPPRPLKRFTFMDSDLFESQDRLREPLVQRVRTFSRWTVTTNKIPWEWRGARLCCRLALSYA